MEEEPEAGCAQVCVCICTWECMHTCVRCPACGNMLRIISFVHSCVNDQFVQWLPFSSLAHVCCPDSSKGLWNFPVFLRVCGVH
jgi:hypothetical protein